MAVSHLVPKCCSEAARNCLTNGEHLLTSSKKFLLSPVVKICPLTPVYDEKPQTESLHVPSATYKVASVQKLP